MSDENSTLHPFELAVLNAKLRRYGFAPVAGNASWFDVVPDEKLTGPGSWRGPKRTEFQPKGGVTVSFGND